MNASLRVILASWLNGVTQPLRNETSSTAPHANRAPERSRLLNSIDKKRESYGLDDFVTNGLSIELFTLSSTSRPAFNSPASLKGGPISWRLVSGTARSSTGTGTANAGFPAKFTGVVFWILSICASKTAVLPSGGLAGVKV